MENQFFVDSEHLSLAALEKKHQLETDKSSRKNHMEYLPGMEIIESDVCRQVLSQMDAFDYSAYTARDVRGQNAIRQGVERVICGAGLGIGHVQYRGQIGTLGKNAYQVVLHHLRTAPGVEKGGVGKHF